MDAVMSAPSLAEVDLATEDFSPVRLLRSLIRAAAGLCAGALFSAAGFLCYRRVVGAVSTPLSTAALAGLGLSLAATAFASRHVWRRTGTTRSASIVLSCLVTVSVLAFAAAATLPDSSSLGLLWLWLLVVGEEFWGWWPRKSASVRQFTPVTCLPQPSVADAEGPTHFDQTIADSTFGLPVPQEHVTQQVTRLLEPDGTERIVGWMRVSFEAGQRLASVHLAFCPPFARSPEATLERLEGPQVRIKRAQVFPFGARFDLKLDTPAERRSDLVLHVAAEVQRESAAPSGGEVSPNPHSD